MNEKSTVYPRKSLVRNIGHDGSEMHCGKTNKFDVDLWEKFEFEINGNVKLDDRIIMSNYRFRNFGKIRKEVGNLKSLRGKNKSEMDEFGEGLIFLISQPRAGSTLLQRILGSHPEMHTISEPWIMLHPLYALKRNGIEAEYVSSLARQGLDDFLTRVPEGEELYIKALQAMASVLYNRMLDLSGKSFFLDKTPRYYFIIPELYRVFPKAKFIFLLRNPMAVLSSVLRTWFGNKIQALATSPNSKDLIKGPHYLIDGINKLKEDAIVVHYENLVGKPEEVIHQVCHRIGIPFYENMLEYGQHPAPKGRHGDHVRIHKHNRPVSDYIDKWVENLTSPGLIEFTYKYLSNLGTELVSNMGYSYQEITDKLESRKFNQQGEDLFAKGDLDEALNVFTKALELVPKNAVTHNNLGVLYDNRGEKDKALNHYQQGAQLQPDNISFQKNLADFYYVEQGRVEEAMQIYVKVLNADPEDIETLLVLSHICVALEKFDDAKYFSNRILKIEPENKDARKFLEKL
ncbi:MAG TPA: sulfotransferase, partial [Balneolales bacterium]|nr:sulfotransferase [Balneolales bacterium]